MTVMTSADKYKHELEKLLLDEVERLKDTVALGFLDDYPQYKQMTGKIAGLRAALDFLLEAESICNGK